MVSMPSMGDKGLHTSLQGSQTRSYCLTCRTRMQKQPIRAACASAKGILSFCFAAMLTRARSAMSKGSYVEQACEPSWLPSPATCVVISPIKSI